MRNVVLNTTPLIVLCNIGHLGLLRELYGEVIIPDAVFKEISAKDDLVSRQVKKNLGWIHVKEETQSRQEDRAMYRAKLHDGEVEVMLLAQDVQADLVVLDDNAAKRTALYLGLNVTGTLGVLLKAKEKGLIEKVAPLAAKMMANGFYLDDDVLTLVLKNAGE